MAEHTRLRVVVERGAQPIGYATEFAAGLTLRAAETVEIDRGKSARVKTGIAIGLVKAMGALIVCHRPASDRGLIAAPEMLSVDDRGAIAPLLTYAPLDPFAEEKIWIHPGDPIAEVTFMPLFRVALFQVPELPSAPGLRPNPDFS